MTTSQRYVKRGFDIIMSLCGLIVTAPIILCAFIIASLETRSNGLFSQIRIGKQGKPFRIYKIKTMRQLAHINTSVTTSNDARITQSGVLFRKTKIDELPQLWNVLIGKMSFVGPRPDMPGYADKLQGSDRLMLSIRPGITGPASIKYKNEEALLAQQDDPQTYNDNVVWPDKVRINLDYIRHYRFSDDIKYILKTITG